MWDKDGYLIWEDDVPHQWNEKRARWEVQKLKIIEQGSNWEAPSGYARVGDLPLTWNPNWQSGSTSGKW